MVAAIDSRFATSRPTTTRLRSTNATRQRTAHLTWTGIALCARPTGLDDGCARCCCIMTLLLEILADISLYCSHAHPVPQSVPRRLARSGRRGLRAPQSARDRAADTLDRRRLALAHAWRGRDLRANAARVRSPWSIVRSRGRRTTDCGLRTSHASDNTQPVRLDPHHR